MRQKSLPPSIRYVPLRPIPSLQVPGTRPRRLPDWLATLVMAVAAPALILPLFAISVAHTAPGTRVRSVEQPAAAVDRTTPQVLVGPKPAPPAPGPHQAPADPGSDPAPADPGSTLAPAGAAANQSQGKGDNVRDSGVTGSETSSDSPGTTISLSTSARSGRTTTTQTLAAPPAPVPALRPPTGSGSILISTSQLATRPMSGASWDSLKRAADAPAGTPNLADQNQSNNVLVLAKALVYARTGDPTYLAQVMGALHAVIGTEAGARTLALGRELAAYVLAADLISLPSVDPAFDATFRAWLASVVARPMVDGSSLRQTHERRPNNWGTHAGASRAAVAAYLGDTAELARIAQVFKGWLGDRSSYAGFQFQGLSWQADPSQPVGINPAGSTIGGHSVDGVLPDDQRRTGDFAWPPPCGNYPYGALDGALLQAEILWHAGYDAYNWQNQALLRAQLWLRSTGCPPSGDNLWQSPLIDARYGTSFWNGAPVPPGKNFGWTSWLYGR